MDIFQEKIKKYDAETASLTQAYNRISLLRLLIFIISGGIIIYLSSNGMIQFVFLVLPIAIACFSYVVQLHQKIEFQKKQNGFLKEINQGEQLRSDCELKDFDTGKEFINPKHPYTADLDIFGHHSIFQLVNRTTTESGKALLSEWLSQAASNEEIEQRQLAIKELSTQLDWRQELQASGMHFQNKKRGYTKLLEWVAQPVVLLKKYLFYRAIAIILPNLVLISFYLLMDNLDSPNRGIFLGVAALFFFLNYLILKRVEPQIHDIVETSSLHLNTMKGYRILLEKIEAGTFKSERLVQLQSVLTRTDYSASEEVKRICKLLDFSHQRPVKNIPLGGNYFYLVFNSFLLIDIYLILGVEKWKEKNKNYLKAWSEVVSEFEVLNSLAGYADSNASYAYPEITDQDNHIHFESLGHPLIHEKVRVCNDFHSKNHGDIVMITGSNMGGKSTFLRTVGVNIVLALAGAPCCAQKAMVSNIRLFTSMRTQDNLLNGISSFYAELNRIELLLELVDQYQNVYFLTDEMFKGTNSEDRHRGGFSLIYQLSKLKTSGIIATHDIELAKVLEQKNLVTNYSFNSEIKDGEMLFSYKLEPFICHDFNASALMERSGIQIIDDDGA